MFKRIVIGLAVVGLAGAGCGQMKEFRRYQDGIAPFGSSEVKVRLMGTAYTEGKIAVGAPYRLFVSIYPALEGLDSLTITLLDISGYEIIVFDKVSLGESKAFEKEGSFMFFEKENLLIDYEEYVIKIDSDYAGMDDPVTIRLKRDLTVKRETDWWTRTKSI